MYPEKPPPYRSQSAVTLQSDHSLGPTRTPVPQSHPRPFHSIPNARASRPQAQRFVQSAPPRSNGPPGTVPLRPLSSTPYVPHGTIAQAVKPQAPRKIYAFVASDPFRVFRGDDDEIDLPSDGLTFDDIPTAESTPGTELSQGRVNNFHEVLPSQTFGGSLPNNAPPPAETYAQGLRPTFYPPLNHSLSKAPEEAPIDQMPDAVPSISNYQVNYCQVPPVIVPLSCMGSSSADQSQSQVFPDLLVPQRPATERPSIVGHRPSFPSHPEDMTFSHFQEEPILTRFTRFFRFGRSHRAHLPPPDSLQPSMAIYHDSEIEWHKFALKIVLVTVPGQLYLLFLLRLPSLYFSRVARIFEEAEMSLSEIKKMALETASQGLTHEFEMQMAFESPRVPPAYKRLTSTWEFFIDSVMREWKTFNIISVLLLSAILTILQIGSVADDPLTRYTALFSLMCALISLLFGCMYIIRFGSMRKSYKAAEWALEAQKTKMLIWWNVWVLLAMPAIWLTWSIILYIVCIMSFIWRSKVTDTTTPPGLSDTGLLAIRIILTVVLGIGLLYGFLILRTFRRYGVVMDRAWQKRIDEWVQGKATEPPESPFIPPVEGDPQSRRYPSMYYGHPSLPTSSQDTYSPRSDASDTYDPTHQTPSIKTRTSSTALSQSSTSKLQCDNHITADQNEYFSNSETTLDDCYYAPALKPPPPEPSLVVSPRQSIPPTPKPPITSFTDQSSEAKDNAEEIQTRFIPKKPSLGVVSPPRPLPPIPETPATPFIDRSSGGEDNALGISLGTGNRDNDDDDMYTQAID